MLKMLRNWRRCDRLTILCHCLRVHFAIDSLFLDRAFSMSIFKTDVATVALQLRYFAFMFWHNETRSSRLHVIHAVHITKLQDFICVKTLDVLVVRGEWGNELCLA